MYKKVPSTIVCGLTGLFIGLFIISGNGCSSRKEQEKSAAAGLLPADFPRAGADAVTVSELKEIVEYLASDRLQGRFSGTRGAGKAADFIAGKLSDYGLETVEGNTPTFIQPFSMRKKRLRESSIITRYGSIENWTGFGERFSNFYGETDTEIVFAGYARKEELSSLNVKDRIVAFFTGEPGNHEGSRELELGKIQMMKALGAEGHMLIYHDEKAADRYELFRKVYYGDFRYYLDLPLKEANNAERAMTVLPSAMASLFGISTETLLGTLHEIDNGGNSAGRYRVAAKLRTLYEQADPIAGANVLGSIRGTRFPGRWIVLTAHYDHLGSHRGDIYNGADDNASGVASLLELAESFSMARSHGWRPEYSILFLFTDAEEIGANGSRFFLDSGTLPPDSIILDINVDAVGRDDPSSSDLDEYVYLYRSAFMPENISLVFQQTAEDMIETFTVPPKIEPPGSDNFIFEMNGIPAAALTTGRSSDYHKPSDTAEKCDYENICRISKYLFSVIWELGELNLSDSQVHPAEMTTL